LILPPAGEDKLIGCDFIIASPLAIRMAAEKEKGTDTLSSIEIVIADGLDAMAMQNWEHVQVSRSVVDSARAWLADRRAIAFASTYSST
jgi:U3 small nucleolar RNA-associated protein 25